MPVKHAFDNLEKAANDERQYRVVTLENDLTALLISDPETEKSSAAVNVHVGSWSDPEEALGLAHFLEHMLFLGTEKYPDENSYNVFLNQHGGHSNAFTDQEDTNYFFDVQNDFFEEALDIFAQFFIAPLFTEAATERELNAVDSENSKNLQEDSWRLFQLYKNLARSDHPFHKFSTGNLQTLKEAPEKSGIDVRQRLLAFHATYYSANVIKLVVLGKESLDTLQGWVDEKFSAVPNKSLVPPSFPGTPYSEAQLRRLVKVVPVRDVRTLQLMWPLPSVHSLYRYKPSSYLSHLIGHESEGSITALLKEKGWANELSAGLSKSYSDFSAFSVSIELTDAGLQNVNSVILIVFQYIAMLNATGPQRWVFDEVRDVAAANFRFQTKIQPMSYASSLASSMERYAHEHVLSGRHLFYEYDPTEIEKLQQMLTPQNLAVVICHREFESEATLREPWYDTAYNVLDLDATLLAEWSSAAQVSELHLPNPNPFIPTEFALKPRVTPVQLQDKASPTADVAGETAQLVEDSRPTDKKRRGYPVRLAGTDDVVFWYKQDNLFDMPKVYLALQFTTPVAYESPASCAMTEVISRCLDETLNRYSYYADVASLSFSVSVNRFGFDVSVAGFDHKAPVLLTMILETLRSMEISAALFDRVKDKVVKNYQNFEFKQAYNHAVYYAVICMEWPRWTHAEKCQALLPITVKETQAFKARLLSSLKIEVLLNGNATPDDCRSMAQTAVSNLRSSSLPHILEPENRVVMLENGHTYIHRRTVFNPEEANSCIDNVYVLGPYDIPINSLAFLFQHIVSEPFFDTLRTKAQLGYIVHISRTLFGADVMAIQAIIQSNKQDPVYLDGKIEEFFQEFRDSLVAMPDTEFAANVQAVIEEMLEKPKNIGEETRQLWRYIESGRYTFELRELSAVWLKTVTREALLEFFDTYIHPSSAIRRKFSVQIYGNKHTLPVEESTDPRTHMIHDITAFKRQAALLGRPVPHPRCNELYEFTAAETA